jgi:hypothetical protein
MNQNDWMNLLFTPAAPAKQATPGGIVFGNISFTEPSRFSFFLPPFSHGGLYAILVPDTTAKPRPFRVIYFGESGELAKRVCPSHEKYPDWVREAGGAHALFVSLHTTTGNKDERVALESRLIADYKPACNDILNPYYGELGRFFWQK